MGSETTNPEPINLIIKKMKKVLVQLCLFIAGLTVITSCTKDKAAAPTTPVNTDITYNAAYVINGGSNSISVIDLSKNEVTRTLALSNLNFPHHVSLNPLKTQLAIGVPGIDLSMGHGGQMMGMMGKIVIVDAKTGSQTKAIELPMSNHNAAFSPDGNEIWTSQMDTMGKVLVYDASTYSQKTSIEVGKMPAEVTFSKDGMTAFVANGESNTVTAIKVSDKSILSTISVGMGPVGAWQGADNKMYVDNEMDKTISVIDVATLNVEETVPLGFMPGYAAYNGAKTELWVTDADNGKVVYFQRVASKWENKGSIVTGAGAHAIAFSKDGMTAYIANQMAGSVSVIDIMNRSKIKDIPVGTKPNGIVIKQ